MKNLLFLFAILGLLIFNACERSADPTSPTPDYYQLKPGNYWVYQIQEIQNDTSVQISPYTDSVYIEKDTLINEINYSKLRGTNWMHSPYTNYLRDSLGYLIDQNGHVYFSVDNNRDTLYAFNIQNIVRIAYKMDMDDSLVSVPAGSFNCLFSRCTVTLLYPSMNRLTRTQGEFRADGIGLIMSSAVNAGEGNYRIKHKLLRYHLVG